MNLTGNWSYPTTIKFGAGRIKEIAAACAETGIKKPLLVTDRGLAGLPITAETLDLLEKAGLGRAIFNEVDPNPNEINLAAGVKAFKDGSHDGVIAFGGGSGLDLGKMVAFMAGRHLSTPAARRTTQTGGLILHAVARNSIYSGKYVGAVVLRKAGA